MRTLSQWLRDHTGATKEIEALKKTIVFKCDDIRVRDGRIRKLEALYAKAQ
jgi:hypothetical protein